MKKKGKHKKNFSLHQQVQEKNRQQSKFLETVLESLTYPFYVIDVNDYTVIMANSAAGISRIASTATCYTLTHKTDKPCDSEEHPCPLEIIKKTKKPVTVEHIHYDRDGDARNFEVHGFPVFDSKGNIVQMIEYCLDITERKGAEQRELLAAKILKRLNRESGALDMAQDVIKFIKESTGFAAVGIRLREADDFPYFAVSGFPDDFVKAENYLCARNKSNKVIYDSQGLPVLECMCGNVIRGCTDTALSFSSEGGSFYTNSTTELLASAAKERQQKPLRNRCNKAGYESVALIPLRSADEVVGLLQLNDTRRKRFTSEVINFFEGICASIGAALARIDAENRIENIAKFSLDNPYPVLRISEQGKIVYANNSSNDLLKYWDRKPGDNIPEDWRAVITESLRTNQRILKEVNVRDSVISFVVAPVSDRGYVNLYGRDITTQKQAEETLRESMELLACSQEIAHLGSWELDLAKNELTWSEEVYRIFGLQPQEFDATYEAFLDRVYPDDRTAVNAAYSVSVKEGKDSYEIEHRVVRKDTGEVRWVHEKCQHVRNAKGDILRSLGMVHDITGRKKAEEQINNLAKFPTENPYPVLRISELGKIIYANNSSVDLLKYWDRKLGENIPEDWQTAITESLNTNNTIFKEVNFGGSVVSFAIAPVAGSDYVNIYGRDITEYRRIEQELKRINEKLELRVKERTEQLQKTVEKLQKEVSERLQAERKLIDNQDKLRDLSTELMAVEERERRKIATQLHDSIGQLLAFSKKELGAVVKSAPENIRKQLESIWDLVRQSVEQTRSLTFDLSSATLYTIGLEAAIEELAERFSEKEGLNCHFSGCDQCKDFDEQMQVFAYRAVRELLVNIVKHAQAQNVEISTKRINNNICIFVSDDGAGFDVNELDGKKGRLSGFGLFSLRERLANIGGDLEIESEIGHGTRVTLTAPLKQNEKPGRIIS